MSEARRSRVPAPAPAHSRKTRPRSPRRRPQCHAARPSPQRSYQKSQRPFFSAKSGRKSQLPLLAKGLTEALRQRRALLRLVQGDIEGVPAVIVQKREKRLLCIMMTPRFPGKIADRRHRPKKSAGRGAWRARSARRSAGGSGRPGFPRSPPLHPPQNGCRIRRRAGQKLEITAGAGLARR